MLEIKPCLDKTVIAPYCKRCGRLAGDAFYLYRATDGEEVLAAGLFQVESSRVVVVYYEGAQEDHFLFDGILRAGLNYAAEQGIELGYIPEEFRQAHKAMFQKLNYPASPEMNITNFFQKYKNCK